MKKYFGYFRTVSKSQSLKPDKILDLLVCEDDFETIRKQTEYFSSKIVKNTADFLSL